MRRDRHATQSSESPWQMCLLEVHGSTGLASQLHRIRSLQICYRAPAISGRIHLCYPCSTNAPGGSTMKLGSLFRFKRNLAVLLSLASLPLVLANVSIQST